MRTRSSRWLIALGAVAVVVAAVVVLLFTQPALSRGVVAKVLGSATGTQMQFGGMALHHDGAVLTDVSVSAKGEPLARIPRMVVSYNLRDLLPGSQHLYGLHAITVYNPRVTVVHKPDGTYNLPSLPKGGPARKNATPMNLTLRVIDGSLAVLDKTRVDPSARDVEVARVNFNAAVNTAARTTYRATMAYVEGGASYPIRGGGVIDTPAGFTLHHWTAAHVPLPQLVNYALNNATLRLRAGYLDNLDARYYGNIAASARIRGGRVTIAGVGAPIENVHGPIDMSSAGLTTGGLTATVAGAPVYVGGGIYDLKSPQFRLTVNTNSDIARLKLMSAAAAKLPVRGPVAISMLVQGSVRAPLAMIDLHSRQMYFREMPFRDADTTIAFDGKTANILHLTTRYAGFSAAARGRMALRKEPNAVEAFASADGSTGQVPYASAILGDQPLHAALLADGESFTQIQTQGALVNPSSPGELTSALNFSAKGVGVMTLANANTLRAKVEIDHPHNAMSALVHANGLQINGTQVTQLPGLSVKSLPDVHGELSGDAFAGKSGSTLAAQGAVEVRNASMSGMRIADARTQFSGNSGAINVSSLQVNGSFGTLTGHGTLAGTNHVALEGHLRGSLAQLAGIAGHLPAQGTVDAPIALLYDNGRAVAQVQDARFNGASVRGVPINSLSATVAQGKGTIDVYAAQARVADSGEAVATGALGSSGSRVAMSVAHFPMSALRGAGVPLKNGVADVGATAQGSLSSPQLSGAAVLDRAQYGKFPLSAGAAFAYGNNALAVHDALVGVGPAFVALDGDVFPRYNLDATMRGLDVADVIALTRPQLQKQYIEGSVDGRVHVSGSDRAPYVAGTIDAPEGSFHGLAFRNLRAGFNGTPSNLAVSGGRVVVGSTALAFNAGIAGRNVSASLNAPRADLSDFNDYFDAGDTLAGTGSVSMNVAMNGRNIASTGDVDLANVRYKRFEIGNTTADWNTRNNVTTARADIGGNSGHVTIAGTYAPAGMTNMTATMRGVDLKTWLPLLGYTQPVTGELNADATAHGRYPDLDLGLNASIANGTVGRIALQQAQVDLTAQRGRGTIEHAIVAIPNLVAQGSGTFGLHANDPLALTMRATSPDLGKLMNTVTGKAYDAAGTLDTTLAIHGTRADPQLRDSFTLASLRYAKLSVPKMWGTLAGNMHKVTLQHGEIDLRRGRVVASGFMPVKAAKNAPVAMDVQVQNVDFSDFESALPHGYHLAGTMAGVMSLRGDVDNPQFNGNIALHNGYFVGPIDQNPISHMNGTLAFTGNSIAIQALHANVGSGTMDVNGNANIPNFRRPGDATFTSRIVATNAQINSPQYFRGKINGDVTISRAVGQKNALIAGNVDIPSARLPLTAFWNPKASKTPAGPPLPIAFNLNANVGNDVRVQSTGVDVGAQGSVNVGGTLASPTLNGAFASTGGTISFLRRFTIQEANVNFDPSNGIMPYVNATATTTVSNPVTTIVLNVTGLAPNNMQLAFSSEPPGYDRQQLMTMLAGFGGNSNGTGGFTQGGVQGLAMGQINTLFTQQLLEPLSASLGSAMGLQNLQLTDDFTSGFGFNAVKAFGKHVTASYSESMGNPRRTSLSIEAHRGESIAFKLMMYSVNSPPIFGYQPGMTTFANNGGLNPVTLTPMLGTNGFTMMYEHKFQ